MDIDVGDFNVMGNDQDFEQDLLDEDEIRKELRDLEKEEDETYFESDGPPGASQQSISQKSTRTYGENPLNENLSLGTQYAPISLGQKRKPMFEVSSLGESPIDWHERWEHGMSKEEKNKAKRIRLETEYMDRLMEKIDNIRAKKFGTEDGRNLSEVVSTDSSETGHNIVGYRSKEAKVYNLIPQNAGNWMRISSPDSETHCYIVTSREKMEGDKAKLGCAKTPGKSWGVLEKCFGDLIREANEIRKRINVSNIVQDENLPLEDTLPPDAANVPESRGGDLWVEKYKPRMYTDLLSDAGVNRTLLTWLKLWDECVFNRKPPKSRKQNNKEFSEAEKLTNYVQERREKKFKKKFANKSDADALNTELDKHKRPEHKIALLCGAPGMGKTTLANVIARVAGYHVVELNASDDRTLEHFRAALEGATQMKSTLDADPRPSCLIIDEIDGAPVASINYLLSLVKNDGSSTGKKKKGVLKRPIICICNDLYVPALRELRKATLVLPFPVTNVQRLTARLQYVCRRENLATDHKTLESLCDKTCQDIRACLNTIQFVSTKTTKISSEHVSSDRRLTLGDVEGAALGQKDAQKSLFNVWHQIFELPRVKGKIHLGQLVVDDESSVSAANARNPAVRFATVLKETQSVGEEEKLRQGIWDNFLNMRIAEKEGMDLISVGAEWFCLTDLWTSLVGSSQAWELMRYPGFLPVVFHLIFASTTYPTIAFPHSSYENFVKTQKCDNILTAVLDGAIPAVCQSSDRVCLPAEILPYVTDIIQPNMRPVSMQLYSDQERRELMHIVSVMLSMNLTYRQQRSEDGTYDFVLEPAVDVFSTFPNVKPGKQLTYSAKQMIGREVELERVRRSERNASRGDSNLPVSEETSLMERDCEGLGSSGGKNTRQSLQKAPTTKNHLQYLQPKSVGKSGEEMETKAPRMFFAPKDGRGNAEIVVPKVGRQDTGIWFKFNSGYSNAVRRNVKMKELL